MDLEWDLIIKSIQPLLVDLPEVQRRKLSRKLYFDLCDVMCENQAKEFSKSISSWDPYEFTQIEFLEILRSASIKRSSGFLTKVRKKFNGLDIFRIDRFGNCGPNCFTPVITAAFKHTNFIVDLPNLETKILISLKLGS